MVFESSEEDDLALPIKRQMDEKKLSSISQVTTKGILKKPTNVGLKVPASPGNVFSVPKSAESGMGILKQNTKKFKEDFFDSETPMNLMPGKSKSKMVSANKSIFSKIEENKKGMVKESPRKENLQCLKGKSVRHLLENREA